MYLSNINVAPSGSDGQTNLNIEVSLEIWRIHIKPIKQLDKFMQLIFLHQVCLQPMQC